MYFIQDNSFFLLELSVSTSPFSIYNWEILILAYFPPGNTRSFGIGVCIEKLGRLSVTIWVFFLLLHIISEKKEMLLLICSGCWSMCDCISGFRNLNYLRKKLLCSVLQLIHKTHTHCFYACKSVINIVSTQQMEIKILQIDWFQK